MATFVIPERHHRFRLFLPKDVRVPFFISLFFATICALFTLMLYTRIQPQVPLFYSLAQLENQLVARHWFLLLPATAGMSVLTHFLGIQFFLRQDHFIIKMISWLSVFFTAFSLFATIRIFVVTF